MPIVPFSVSLETKDLVFLSGEIGRKDGSLVRGGVRHELAQAIENVTKALKAHGLTLGDVVDVTAFLLDASDYDAFNDAYEHLFLEPFPTRTTIAVKWLPMGARVELKMIARKRAVSKKSRTSRPRR